MSDKNGAGFLNPMFHDMNIRDPGNPQGVWGTVPPMPQDYQSQVYQLPADIIFTLTEQNRRLAVHV